MQRHIYPAGIGLAETALQPRAARNLTASLFSLSCLFTFSFFLVAHIVGKDTNVV